MEGAATRTRLVVAGVVVVAFAARLQMVLRGAGLEGLHGYDDGVYYAAASSLVNGRVPYRDFVLLHPPGVVLLLSPFALLGRLTSDHVGFAAARVAFMLLGAVNAGAVAALGARSRRPAATVAAVAGGLFAALWFSSIYASRTTLLETPASTLLLVALLLLWRRTRTPGRWAQLAAGAALGGAAAVKIWGVVPLLVVVAWQLRTAGRWAAGRVLGGAAAAVVVVCLGFFVLDPAAMTRLVLLDQLHRPLTSPSPLTRALDASSLTWNLPHVHLDGTRVALGVVALAAVALVVLAVVAWRQDARLPVVLLAACAAVLVLSPSYFTHYGELLTPPAALVTGAAAAAVATWLRDRARADRLAVLAVVPLLVILGLDLHTVTRPLGHPIDTARLRAAVAGRGCVASDTPAALAVLDVL
ncbi:MAG: glycosyltransferase 87 family protein, partial [Angustibacter sp.]